MQSIMISMCVFVCLSMRSLLCRISSLPLAYSVSNLTHRVSLDKWYVVTLNHISKSKVKVISEIWIILVLSIFFSPFVQPGSYYPTPWHSAFEQGGVWLVWMMFAEQGLRLFKTIQFFFFSEHRYFFCPIWLILYINRPIGQRMCCNL